MDQVAIDELINLENRVSLAQRLFPNEAQAAMENCPNKGTSEFILTRLEHDRLTGAKRTSSGIKRKREKIIEEYQTRLKALFKTGMSHLPDEILEEYQHPYQTRLKALSKTVEYGKRFFPRCSAVMDLIMDCEPLTQLACGEEKEDTPEKQQQKMKRYMEIQETVMKAFSEDKEELGNLSLCSSTASCSM